MNVTTLDAPGVGTILRDWRQRRRLSQLDLALEAGISTRHLSFVETGRSKPSADMVLHLAEQLEVPLRDRNALLLAAGYAPQYGARSLGDPDMAHIRDALGRVLDGHEPFPAIAVDRYWNVVGSNSALDVLLYGVADELLEPPANGLRIALRPDGMPPRVINFAAWRSHLLQRVERAVAATGDPQLAELQSEILSYPGPPAPEQPDPGEDVTFGLKLAAPGDRQELSFFSTITTFGTPLDITVSEIAIEAFFPADDATSEWLTANRS